ncbi:MAG: hypothetical protein U0R44_02780 [Candidatus Micrarchaeia archaeon]
MKGSFASPKTGSRDPPSEDGKSLFARYFPAVERWRRRKALIGRLVSDSIAMDRKSGEWEGRGHWERAGRCKEQAALRIRTLMDIELRGEHIKRYEGLLRDAVVLYALEIGEAGRYDPAIHYRIYLAARGMGDAALAKKHFTSMVDGLALMVIDQRLERLVSLNRAKREFLSELWEGDTATAFVIANEALAIARTVPAGDGKGDRERDTIEWIEKQVTARFAAQAKDSGRSPD